MILQHRSFQVSGENGMAKDISRNQNQLKCSKAENSENYVDFYRKRKRNRRMKIGRLLPMYTHTHTHTIPLMEVLHTSFACRIPTNQTQRRQRP